MSSRVVPRNWSIVQWLVAGLLSYTLTQRFSRENDKGYALRGAVYLRMGTDARGVKRCHLIEAVSQSHKLVVRSTFAAELLALTASVDQSFIIITTLHEICFGPLNPQSSINLRENGGYLIELYGWIDARSVFSAVENENFKYPTEKSLLSSHLMDKTIDNIKDHHHLRMGWYTRHGCRWNDKRFHRSVAIN